LIAARKPNAPRAPKDRGEIREYSSPPCYLHEFEPHPAPTGVPDVHIKRVYDEPHPADGFRVLVDRLWPRGIKKDNAVFDVWMRELAPSTELRKWFHQNPARWNEFRKKYRDELLDRASELEALRQRAGQQRLTLIYAARDPKVNHAAVLEEIIRKG
jgi:uncharacterized protein YeaO (DUF488 family)